MATTFFVITHLLGTLLVTILVLVTLVIPGQWSGGVGVIQPIGVIFVLGVLMIPAQAISVSFASKLSKEIKLENSESKA
jgi:hypothetical protein